MKSALPTFLAFIVAGATAIGCNSVSRQFGNTGGGATGGGATGGATTGTGGTTGTTSTTATGGAGGATTTTTTTTTSAHCTNGTKDADETDVDCGGSACSPCAFGLGCMAGADCASTYCTAGACSALTLGTVPSPNCTAGGGCTANGSGIHQLAVDATSVYVTCYGTYGASDGSVVKLPVGGGTVTTLAATQANPTGIALDSAHVYWTNNAFGGGNGTVASIPLGGGTPTTLASAQPFADKLALVGGTLYWTNDAPNNTGAVVKIGIGGGNPTVIASALHNPDAIACDGSNCYYTTGGDPSSLYSVAVGGGTPAAVALAQHAPITVAVDGAGFYWAEYSPTNVNHVSSAPLAGGTPNILATLTVGNGGAAVATDGTHVYWIENSATKHQIKKVLKTGGAPTVLAAGNLQALGLVLDAGYAYWVTDADGAVFRVHK